MTTANYLVMTAVSLVFISTAVGAIEGNDLDLGWPIPVTKTPHSSCRGTIAECLAGDGEIEMDSEINRRILATPPVLPYGVLMADFVPCRYPGVSYGNCRPGQANQYHRPCSYTNRCLHNPSSR
ncbi:hypothetical protein Nepgr_021885 [Nepenthes gracilis]|uniref:Uncharacterized protein n=1 Tax=Nepenthes gracilis TaxID=150966 RepID=A0AAD3SZY7_NEPGR|nr:hypothetical protein Nepgr_021885 [Nepenthes gracilis]